MGELKVFPMKSTIFSSAKSLRERVAGSWPPLAPAVFGAALLVGTLVLFSGPGMAQTNAPAVLPGKGLAQHDFFYAGEAKAERMSIVRGGQVVWS